MWVPGGVGGGCSHSPQLAGLCRQLGHRGGRVGGGLGEGCDLERAKEGASARVLPFSAVTYQPPKPPPSRPSTPPPPSSLPQGEVLLVRQLDQPGIIAAVSSELAKHDINISYMTVSRSVKGVEAIMAIGVDSPPGPEVGGRTAAEVVDRGTPGEAGNTQGGGGGAGALPAPPLPRPGPHPPCSMPLASTWPAEGDVSIW